MKTLIILMCAVIAIAQDKKPTEAESLAAKVKTLEQDARFSRLEKAALLEQLASSALDKAKAETQTAYADACKGANLPVDPTGCVPDWGGRKVVKPAPVSTVSEAPKK